MRILLFFCVIVAFCVKSIEAQVGIGTTNPNATFDIRSSNQAMPASNDGMLIPKVDEFPATDPTALQDGMLVYVTGNGTSTKGFYYWDETLSDWISVSGAKCINDLIDGKTNASETSIFLGNDAGLNSSAFNNTGVGSWSLRNTTTGSYNTAIGRSALVANVTGERNLAIGASSLLFNLSGSRNLAIGNSALSSNTSGERNLAVGSLSLGNNTTGFRNLAIGSQAQRNNAIGEFNTSIGHFSLYSSVGNGNVALGYEAGYFETGNNKLYISNSSANSDNALIYGEFDNNILRTNSQFQIGNPTLTGYAFPTVDGATNEVLQTDGSGSLSWVNSNSTVIHSINDLTDGKSDNDGTHDGSSIFLGINAGLNDDGTHNRNIGIGSHSLHSNTSGSGNTAIGFLSLALNNDGDSNTAVGRATLYNNTSGNFNTAIGSSTLSSNTTGTLNTAVGVESLVSNTTAQQNTSIGFRSLTDNTTGNQNTAVGTFSLFNNITGLGNVAVGVSTLVSNTTGNNNAGLGRFALYTNEDGYDNVAIGGSALYSNISGFKNVAIGQNAGYNEIGSDKLYIENSSSTSPLIYGEFDNDVLGFNANVGIGTQTPSVRLHATEEGTLGAQTIVAGLASNVSNRPVLQFSETTTIDLSQGMSLEYNGTGSGGSNRMVINGVGGNPLFEFRNNGLLTLNQGDVILANDGTDRGIIMQDDSGNNDRVLMRQNTTQDIYLGDIDDNNGDVYIRAGGTNVVSVIEGTNRVGIGINVPAYQLQLSTNSAAKPTSGSWTVASDKRLKTNIKPFTDGMNVLKELDPVWFSYNGKAGISTNERGVGTIAQELQKTAPYMVNNWEYEDEKSGSKTTYLGVNYGALDFVMVNALKEQDQTITKQQQEIDMLKKELQLIKELLKQRK